MTRVDAQAQVFSMNIRFAVSTSLFFFREQDAWDLLQLGVEDGLNDRPDRGWDHGDGWVILGSDLMGPAGSYTSRMDKPGSQVGGRFFMGDFF